MLRTGRQRKEIPVARQSSGPPAPSLDRLPVGSSARVSDVSGVDPTALRLLEMGLTPGITVRVIGRAPLGDPLELEVRGYRLSIRDAEAARVAVAPA